MCMVSLASRLPAMPSTKPLASFRGAILLRSLPPLRYLLVPAHDRTPLETRSMLSLTSLSSL